MTQQEVNTLLQKNERPLSLRDVSERLQALEERIVRLESQVDAIKERNKKP